MLNKNDLLGLQKNFKVAQMENVDQEDEGKKVLEKLRFALKHKLDKNDTHDSLQITPA
jgi:hypothetical protein